MRYGTCVVLLKSRDTGSLTGRSQSYAFVDFDNLKDAEDAIMDTKGRDIAGRTVTVSWSHRAKNRGSLQKHRYDDERDPVSSSRSRSRRRRRKWRRRYESRSSDSSRSRSRSRRRKKRRRRRRASSSRSRSRSFISRSRSKQNTILKTES